MRNHQMILLGFTIGIFCLSGCGIFRWSGYYSHDDTYPQLHYDWAKDPYFPAGSNGQKPPEIKFPKTPKEHQEAAERYLAKAKNYRLEAKVHKEMKTLYEKVEDGMANRCDEMIKKFEALADAMDRFAEWHKEQAEKTKQ